MEQFSAEASWQTGQANTTTTQIMARLFTCIMEVSGSVTMSSISESEKYRVTEKVKTLFDAFSDLNKSFLEGSKSPRQTSKKATDERVFERRQTEIPTKSNIVEDSKDDNDVTVMERIAQLEQKLEAKAAEDAAKSEELWTAKQTFIQDVNSVLGMRQSQERIEESLFKVQKEVAKLRVLQRWLNDYHKNVKKRETLSTELSDIKSEVLSLRTDLSGMRNVMQAEVDRSGGRVAFAATAKSIKLSYYSGDKLKFGRVSYNTHSCYDTDTSVFTAPSDGLYFFAVSVNTNSPGEFSATIVHNSIKTVCFGTPDIQDSQTSTSIVLDLSSGDMVWIQATDFHHSSSGVQIGSGFSNFLGFQIQ